jgi:hypothetical protein
MGGFDLGGISDFFSNPITNPVGWMNDRLGVPNPLGLLTPPKAPPPPDASQAVKDQFAANLEAAKQTSLLNNPNVIGPYGTQTYTTGPDGRPTLTQTLSPEQQNILDQQNKMKGLMGTLGTQVIQNASGTLGKPLDFSGAPAIGTGQSTRDQVINAMMSRSNADLGKQWDQTNSDLVARGIAPGTAAYQREQDLQARSRNDAFQQAQIAGGNAASQQQGMDINARNNYLSGLLTQRQTPLNELSALQSGSQVNNPFAGNLGFQAGANVNPAPVMQGAQMTNDYNTNLYNVNSANQNAMMRGLFSLGSAGIMASDRRLKRNIKKIGRHPIGVNLYEFTYIWGQPGKGVMADELEKVMPEAVLIGPNGYKLVDYSMIGGIHA